jgi:hypothetical protein
MDRSAFRPELISDSTSLEGNLSQPFSPPGHPLQSTPLSGPGAILPDPQSVPAPVLPQAVSCSPLPVQSTTDFAPFPPGENEVAGEPDEEFEINPETDPLQSAVSQSMAEWEEAVRKIVPMQPIYEDPQQQRQRVTELLEPIRHASTRSNPESQAEAEAILLSLQNIPRDPDKFVVGAFTSCHAAWTALLENSKRQSAKTVLGWLQKGVKPQFVGTSVGGQGEQAGRPWWSEC